ncbi:NAD(P)H-hydrate dehydratase [Hyphococcus flavus]|uniref:Bifunctional NAD(P)H-hydrate repair enzyme n=1 Tax=Hyphococcus flavus TaxID=1866326 RepID=A0AAE9ZBK4_9PROT|nr:NAD(P)H-hydrate dehydratase [Hyphococcus flavus]WDI31749.1 NAD(P)H-hydrate dehydratase [Hyphococcus flavus]
MNPLAVLSAKEMRAAEQAAINGGVASAALMETAGKQVAEVAKQEWSKRPVAVICGPGNNGGDGFVAARLLAEAEWPVKVVRVCDRETLKGDAKLMADLYEGEVSEFDANALAGVGLIIDAIFGTGLTRPIEGDVKTALEAINAHPAPVLSVDIPSGVSTDEGAVLGFAIQAARTVTFHAKQPAHLLFPGRALCGVVDVVDIGITGEFDAKIFENHPSLWGARFPRPSWMGHKYERGHVMCVSGGPMSTGAARLAAEGALRIGAGLVTMLSPSAAAPVHASHLTSIMLREANTADEIAGHMQDAEKSNLVTIIGPATGVSEQTRDKTLAILNSSAGAVLDADALTSFAGQPDALFDVLRPDDVLTPHTGEFSRLFSVEMKDGGKLDAARAASKKAGCIVVLKGPDTIIAAPDGLAIINSNAPPDLATAGSGDVLAGLIAGLKAQGMGGFEAAAAGVWFHGACGQTIGPGLIAEDLPKAVPSVLRQLLKPLQEQDDGLTSQQGAQQQ